MPGIVMVVWEFLLAGVFNGPSIYIFLLDTYICRILLDNILLIVSITCICILDYNTNYSSMTMKNLGCNSIHLDHHCLKMYLGSKRKNYNTYTKSFFTTNIWSRYYETKILIIFRQDTKKNKFCLPFLTGTLFFW